MASNGQKEQERCVLERYLEKRQLKGCIKDSERPDFIIISGNKVVGVEVTEYHQTASSKSQFPRRQVEEEWKKLKCKAWKYSSNSSDLKKLKKLDVKLSFSELLIPSTVDHKRFIDLVYKEIALLGPDLDGETKTINICAQPSDLLSQYLTRIEVSVTDCDLEWNWNFDWSRPGTSDEELLKISRKKFKMRKKECLDELHLIIDGFHTCGEETIGHLSSKLLERCLKFNKAMKESDYCVVAILGYPDSVLWQRDQGWTEL